MKRSRTMWWIGLVLGLLGLMVLALTWSLGFEMGFGCAERQAQSRRRPEAEDTPGSPEPRRSGPKLSVVDAPVEEPEPLVDSALELSEDRPWTVRSLPSPRRRVVMQVGRDTGEFVSLVQAEEPVLDPVCGPWDLVAARRGGQLELWPEGVLLGPSLEQPAAFSDTKVFWAGPEEMLLWEGELAVGMGEGQQLFGYRGGLLFRRGGTVWAWSAEVGVADTGVEGSWPSLKGEWMAWVHEGDLRVGKLLSEPVYAETSPGVEGASVWLGEDLLALRVRLGERDAIDVIDLEGRTRTRVLEELDPSASTTHILGSWLVGWSGTRIQLASVDGLEQAEFDSGMQAIHGLCWSEKGLVVAGRLRGVEGLYRIDTALQ